MALLHGIDRGSDGSLSVTASGTIVFQNGIPLTSGGDLRTTANTGAPPAGTKVIRGVAYASDGTILTTTDAIGLVDNGIAYTTDRIVCVTANAVANSSKSAYLPGVGFVLVDTTGRVHVS